MARLVRRTARSAGQKPLPALLCVLALTALGSWSAGALAAGGKPDFSLAASPSSQTIVKTSSGSTTATYSVSVTRVNGMTDAVALSLSGAPVGVSGSFSPNPVGGTQNSSALTLTVTSAVTPGSYSLTVTGVGSNPSETHTAPVRLVVQPASTPDFNVSASPATQTITQGDAARVDLTVNRLNGYAGTVTLSQSGAPTPSNISFDPSSISSTGTTSTLIIDTSSSIGTGTYTITIAGTDSADDLAHSATVTLVVQPGTPHHFQIAGNARNRLYPGEGSTPIDLSLTNANPQQLTVTNITVSIEQATNKPGCPADGNYRVTQIPAAAYSKIVLPPNSTRTLLQLGVTDDQEPQIEMLGGGNQDGCEGATVYLDFTGTGTN